MLKNYIKIGLRNLARQKTLAFINIFGLSVGIACFFLFGLYALNEFNYDSFNKNAANVYRVYNWREAFNGNDAGGNIYQPLPLGPAIKKDIPGVANYVRYVQPYETFIQTEQGGRREKIGYADPAFFSMFSLQLKYGNAATALQDMKSIVLTVDAARRLFGRTDIIGKTLKIKSGDDFEPFIITGVAENPPSNSSFQFGIMASIEQLATTQEGKFGKDNWHWSSYLTFVQLEPGNGLEQTKMLPVSFRAKYFSNEESYARNHGWKGQGPAYSYRLQPLTDIHTTITLQGMKIPPVDPKVIWILLGIAVAILLIACINFTTLSLGRSAGRAKEVGIRKAAGSTKRALIFQFMTESLILAILSTIIGLFLANILLPYFNLLSERDLKFSLTQFPQLSLLVGGTAIIVGILSGSYPAMVLSGINVVEALKTKIKMGGGNFFTKSLVTFQFVLSAGLIISAVVIIRQLDFMQSRYPGFDKENVIAVNATGVSVSIKNLYPLFKQEMASCPDIVAIGGAGNGIGEGQGMLSTGFQYQGKTIGLNFDFVDPAYITTLGMHLLAGRNFDRSISSDTVNTVIINETMMNELKWEPSNSVGRRLEGYTNFGLNNPEVIGVVKDFNYMKLTKHVEPFIFTEHSGAPPFVWRIGNFYLRIKPGNPSKSIEAIEKAWRKLAPEFPLRYNFLDEDLNRFYVAESRLSSIMSWAGGIAILLASLGLFGLVTLSVVNRTKEIGIRKVLGASVSVVIGLISKDFLKLVLIALIIATPLTDFIMNRWLQDYAFRVTIGWWIFLMTGAAIICIAFLTVLFHAAKAATANLVESLRNE